MVRLRLKGYYGYYSKGEWIECKDSINAEHRASGTHGTIETRFISRDKIKEMESNGFAYVNKPKEYLV